jgi:hypothetical protein
MAFFFGRDIISMQSLQQPRAAFLAALPTPIAETATSTPISRPAGPSPSGTVSEVRRAS